MPIANSKSYTTSKFQLPAISSDFGSLTAGTNIPPPAISPTEEHAPALNPSPASKYDFLDTSKLPALQSNKVEITTNGTESLNFYGVPNNQASNVRPQHSRNTSIASRRTSSGLVHDNGAIHPVGSPSRPNSIRRFLSRNSLSTQYIESTPTSPKEASSPRPVSPGTTSTYESPRPPNKKRSSSWFSKFSSSNVLKEEPEHYSENKRESNMYQQRLNHSPKRDSQLHLPHAQKPIYKGPPPPQLPHLSSFKAKLTEETTMFDAESMFANIK